VGKIGRGEPVLTEFTERVIQVIKNIPEGKVLSYGGIASLAGSPRGARQVTRTLHTMSGKHNLPWHRVVNSKGRISLKDPLGYEEQKHLLELEGIVFSSDGRIDPKYFWDV
jgi:methylated-DNA-protein-cysteine methyltransferase-like protein